MQDIIARRNFLKAIPLTVAGLTAVSGSAGAQTPAPSEPVRTLVAYFSRTGNTALVARQICRAQVATLLEIKPARPYPEDYNETVAQAARETREGYLPPLGHFVADIRQYDTIYLGFPIWGTTAPPIIRSFLRGHDTSGKQLRPFITHGGYGLGDSLDIVKSLAPEATVHDAFAMKADQEKQTLEQVTAWLRS